MKRLVSLIIFAVLVVSLIDFMNSDGNNPTSPDVAHDGEPALIEMVVELSHSVWSTFGEFATLEVEVQIAIWKATPAELRPILGISKCLVLFLALLGLSALRTASRLARFL